MAAICEGPSDFRTIEGLIGRMLREVLPLGDDGEPVPVEWLPPPNQPNSVQFFKLSALARPGAGFPKAPKFQATDGYENEARRALFVVGATSQQRGFAVQMVVLLRDSDREPKARRQSYERARTASPQSPVIAIGIPDPCREAWVLNCFAPQDDHESKLLEEERVRLKFDPCMSPDKLNGAAGTDRCVKRVTRALTGDSHDREDACWQSHSITDMRLLGSATGLADFIDDLENGLPRAVASAAAP